MEWVNCKEYADEILDEVANYGGEKKTLLILSAWDDPASESYMFGKMKDCKRCGIPVKRVKVDSQVALMWNISIANFDDSVGGIIVQLPLPEGFDAEDAISAIRLDKDVDGFQQNSRFKPCTPEGIIHIAKKELGQDLSGRTVLLVGKGKLVGRPLVSMLLDEGCTLTVAHSRTKGLKALCRSQFFDIVITAAGKTELVDLGDLNARLVIDASIGRDCYGKLAGDCCCFSPHHHDFMRVTPVPGGVGLMTRAMLMRHMVS